MTRLAETTARATDDIKVRIERLQAGSRDAAVAIDQVTKAVSIVESTQNVIAAAVEEQSAPPPTSCGAASSSRHVGRPGETDRQFNGIYC